MALTKCFECQAQISTQAKTCPHCGAKAKKSVTLGGLLLWTVLIVGGCVALTSKRDAEEAQLREASLSPTERAARDAKREKENTEFANAVIAAKAVREAMKNPKSFEISWAIYTEAGAFCMEYRGTNSFNAVVPGTAVLQPDGKLVSGSGAATAKPWNKHCANQTGRDMMHIRHAL